MLRCVTGLLCLLSLLSHAEGPPSGQLRMCYTPINADSKSLAGAREYALFDRFYVKLRDGIAPLGLSIEAQQFPWKRCAHLIATGQMDATVPVIWSPERETWAVYPKASDGSLDESVRLRRAEYFVYVSLDSDLVWNDDSFSDTKSRLWAPIGYKVYDKLREDRALTMERYAMAEAFTMVSRNRLDGVVVEANDGDYHINQLKLADKIKRLPLPYYSNDWYLVFSYEFFELYPQIAREIWLRGIGKKAESVSTSAATQ
ncbi:MAG: hypothetical protein ACRBBW_02030 [Cellvibrionaceae bacterium]